MTLLLIVILLIVLFGAGGYHYDGYRRNRAVYHSGYDYAPDFAILVIVVIVILYFAGVI